MKKILLALIALVLTTAPSWAIDDVDVLNLKTHTTYIIPLKSRPINLENSNTNIIRAEAITDIFDADSSILLTTKAEGIAYLDFKQNDKQKTIRILVDNRANEDSTLLKLDTPYEMKNVSE